MYVFCDLLCIINRNFCSLCVLLISQRNVSVKGYGSWSSYPAGLNHKLWKDFGHNKWLCLVRDAPKPQVSQTDRYAQVTSSASPQVWAWILFLILQKEQYKPICNDITLWLCWAFVVFFTCVHLWEINENIKFSVKIQFVWLLSVLNVGYIV